MSSTVAQAVEDIMPTAPPIHTHSHTHTPHHAHIDTHTNQQHTQQHQARLLINNNTQTYNENKQIQDIEMDIQENDNKLVYILPSTRIPAYLRKPHTYTKQSSKQEWQMSDLRIYGGLSSHTVIPKPINVKILTTSHTPQALEARTQQSTAKRARKNTASNKQDNTSAATSTIHKKTTTNSQQHTIDICMCNKCNKRQAVKSLCYYWLCEKCCIKSHAQLHDSRCGNIILKNTQHINNIAATNIITDTNTYINKDIDININHTNKNNNTNTLIDSHINTNTSQTSSCPSHDEQQQY